jgi:ribosomal protein S18 acetylase RimI-like enzyme
VELRPATADDLAAIDDLQRRYDVAWFGASEHSRDEVAEWMGYADPLVDNSLLLLDGDRPVAAALRFGTDSLVAVDPEADAVAVYERLLPWFAERPGMTEVLSRDEASLAAVEAAGWTYSKSTFDLLADVTPELKIAEPVWPVGVALRDFDVADAAAIHRLIYVDAAWAELPGHPERGFEEWQRVFVTQHTIPSQQVVACRGERIVGVAMGRTWDDGTGWISQLATAKDERGRGIGRAMLLEALRRRIAAGATSLGLSVQAANRAALQMYLAAGLKIDREFRTYKAPDRFADGG